MFFLFSSPFFILHHFIIRVAYPANITSNSSNLDVKFPIFKYLCHAGWIWINSAIALLFLLLLLLFGFLFSVCVDFDSTCGSSQRCRHVSVISRGCDLIETLLTRCHEDDANSVATGSCGFKVWISAIGLAPGFSSFAGNDALLITFVADDNEWELGCVLRRRFV